MRGTYTPFFTVQQKGKLCMQFKINKKQICKFIKDGLYITFRFVD